VSRIRLIGLIAATALAIGCGGSGDSTGPTDEHPTNAKVLTATINSAAFTANTVSGGYLNGALTINGVNGVRSLTISAIGLNGPGTYSLSFGNANSALAQIIDGNTGQFSTGFTGGSGSITLSVATLGHVKGQFNFIAYTTAGTAAGRPVVTVQNGVFDITNP
jgi:hypothetical protein